MKFAMAVVLLLVANASAAPPKFELVEGDRVVFIGNMFVERDIQHNYLETLLTTRWRDRNITFRNLGWSGDTVFVPARAGSGPNRGIDLLMDYVKELRPTVLFVAYGMNESFEGEAGLSRFVDGYNKLLDALAATKARVILIGPIAHEDLGRPLPDGVEHNKQLKMYSEAIRLLAAKRDASFVNLFDRTLAEYERQKPNLTDNGIHLNALGYWLTARMIVEELGMKPPPADSVGEDGRVKDAKIEQLRQVIRQKNVFFFDRYRPQNDMYIFWGRKHEQGRNAVEIPQFEKFIEAKEAEINELKKR